VFVKKLTGEGIVETIFLVTFVTTNLIKYAENVQTADDSIFAGHAVVLELLRKHEIMVSPGL